LQTGSSFPKEDGMKRWLKGAALVLVVLAVAGSIFPKESGVSAGSKILVAVIGLAVLAVVGRNQQESQWRQKMSVVVETPDNIITASSVISVDVEIGNRWLSNRTAGSGVSWKIRGEAVVVDLGGGRYLFALLKGARGYQSAPGRNALYAFADMEKYNPAEDILPVSDVVAAKRDQPVTLAPEFYPLLVTFDDVRDPKTVKRVAPDDLAKTFGAGFRLKAITLAITGEPVTKGRVEKVLGWLGKYPEPRLGPATGQTSNIPFNRYVSHGDFIRR
jgi:hypothetical protein